jgi:hypothetical protein
MKRPLLLLFVVCTSFRLSAQSVSDTSFSHQKQVIDSLVQSIEANKLLTHILATGDLMWGQFKGNCYYVVGSGMISKMECFFADSSAGKKVMYYKDNELLRIIDKGVPYYFAGSKLFYADGRPVKPYIARDMVFFAQEANKLMLNVLE